MDTVEQAIHEIFQNNIIIDGLMVRAEEKMLRDVRGLGFTAGNVTVAGHEASTLDAMKRMEQHRWVIDRMSEKAMIIHTLADLDRAHREGMFGVIFGFQGSQPIGHDFHLVAIFWRLGLRVLGLTYNDRNAIGDGCLEPENRGLSRFGIEVARECNRLGIVIDLSHAGRRTSLDAIDISEHPCVFTHSNPDATWQNPRNITDEQMKKVAARGGVVGLGAWSNFVGDSSSGRHPTRAEYVRQIEYAVDLIGPDHVAIGTDIFVGRSHDAWWDANTKRRYPELSGGMTAERHNIAGFDDYSGFVRTAEDLHRRGYKEEHLKKILGGNWYRVFSQVLPA